MEAHTAPPSTPSDQERSVVLIVDDSRVMRIALKRILQQQFQVIEAGDGEAAWSELVAHPEIQAVFSDLSMPELDGFGLLARVRESEYEHIRDLPFIVITGNEDDQTVRERALGAGATDFVVKPFQTVEIAARAKAHVGNRQQMARQQAEMQERTSLDSRTGLYTPKFFHQRLVEALSFARRQAGTVGLVLLQLEGEVSDWTDEVLVMVSQALKSHTRSEDVVGHVDEGCFGVAVAAATDIGIQHMVKRILAEISDENQEPASHASVGVALAPSSDVEDSEQLLTLVQRRLAEARRQGAGSVVDQGFEPVRRATAAEAPAATSKVDDNQAELSAAREAADRRNAELNIELEELRARLERMQSESTAAEEKLEGAQKQIEVLQSELQQAQAARGQAETAAQQAEQRLQSLESDLQATRTELQEHQDASGEAAVKLAELEERLTLEKQEASARADRMGADQMKLKRELEQSREELVRLQAQLARRSGWRRWVPFLG